MVLSVLGLLVLLQVAAPPPGRQMVASGVVENRAPDETPLDSIGYALWRERGVVWVTITQPGRGEVEVPSSTVAALEASLDYHLDGRGPARETAVGFDDGAVHVGLERTVPAGPLAAGGLAVVALGALAVGLVRERRRSAHLRVVSRHQTESRERERLRVAQEIHDGPVQAYSAALHALARGDDSVPDRLREATAELRRIAAGLRPPALDRFGLPAALADLADHVEHARPDVRVLVDADPDAARRLSPDAALAAYRVAQEATSNAVAHGGARVVRVGLEGRPSEVVLAVSDDGGGFADGVPRSADLSRAGHFGLVGMRERAGAVGGRLDVASSPEGVTVTLAVPTAPGCGDGR